MTIMIREDVTPQAIIEDAEIITITSDCSDSDEMDYDFDYDPNEMYYALNGIDR
jgi:hypothetical protein